MKKECAKFWVAALGGTSATAAVFNIKPPSVSGWLERGRVPPARMMYLRLAYPELAERWDAIAAQQGME
jgi:DNA-binding transcriptional regulator YdaS (Cro superfamily)